MTVKDAKNVAYEWVIKMASKTPGFYGAFYHGSINWLSEDAILPATSDVDIIVVFAIQPPGKLGKFIYGNVILDVSYLSMDELRSIDLILGQYHLAGSFRTPNIISDPSGQLTKLQKAIAKDYAKRYWVYKRCQDAMNKVLRYLRQLNQSDLLHDQVTCWLFARGVMTHVLLVTGLKNPTVRQRYVAVQKLLADYHYLDFYEVLLKSLGCVHMNPTRVEHHLTTLTDIFDAAKSVIRTPYQFAADISDIARPIVIDGSYELIKQGYHREALFWIVATYSRCQHILFHDASVALQNRFSDSYRQLLEELHVASYSDLQLSNQQAMKLLPRVWEVAEEIIEANKDIKD